MRKIWTGFILVGLGFVGVLGGKGFGESVVGKGGVEEISLGGISWPVEEPTVSEDGRHFAYVRSKGFKKVVVVDGKDVFECDEVGEMAFNGEGKNIFCSIRRGAKWFLCVDGVVGPGMEKVEWGGLSPDSKRWGYYGKNKGRSFMVVDGEVVGPFEGAASLTFSEDSKHVAYRLDEGGKSVMVIDGARENKFDAVGKFVFSPDGKHHAYEALVDKSWCVVEDGVRGALYEDVEAEELRFSGDSQKLAYVAGTGVFEGRGQEEVVVNGESQGAYDSVSGVIFSPDSTHLAYTAKRDGKWAVRVDGKPVFTDVDGGYFAYSPDSRHTFFATNTGRGVVVQRDGKEIGKGYDKVEEVVFSPDSQRVAYSAEKDGGWFFVVDGKPETSYRGVEEKMFSEDSRHFAYMAMEGDHWRVVVDGDAGLPYAAVLHGSLKFRADDTVVYLAVRDQTLYRVREKSGR